MTTLNPLKSRVSARRLAKAGFLLLLCGIRSPVYSQCASAPIAAQSCSGGNGAASSGTNINSGNLYWFSGGPAVFSGINLNNGGTFRVCGTLTLSTINYNGGTLIVENGGNLTINSPSMNLSGVTIINRGTLTINGSVTLQGSGNTVYNDLPTSVLTISGTLTLNGASSFVINRGLISINMLNIQGTTGAVCLQDNAILSLTELENNFTYGISYSGIGAPACLNVSTTAILNNDVTSSSNIHVCTNAVPTGGAAADATGGWGSATVSNGCSNCATVLATEDIRLSALVESGSVRLEWKTREGLLAGDVFVIERSPDGLHFSPIGSREAAPGENSYTFTDAVAGTKLFYRVRLVRAVTGVSLYSTVTEVDTEFAEGFRLYPNPAVRGQAMTVVISSLVGGTGELTLIDATGLVESVKPITLTAGDNRFVWDTGVLSTGVYFIRLKTPDGRTLHSRLVLSGSER